MQHVFVCSVAAFKYIGFNPDNSFPVQPIVPIQKSNLSQISNPIIHIFLRIIIRIPRGHKMTLLFIEAKRRTPTFHFFELINENSLHKLFWI